MSTKVNLVPDENGNDPFVQLSGSIAPDAVPNPLKLIASVPFTNFIANTAYTQYFASSLTRNAKRRTFYINNTMNQTLTGISFFPTDSLAPRTTSGLGTSAVLSSASPGAVQYEFDNLQQPILGFAGNSFLLSMSMGATAPTSGTVNIYVSEVL